jgi:hypothetical protein
MHLPVPLQGVRRRLDVFRRTARLPAEVEVDAMDQSTLLAALLVRTRPPLKEREAGVDLAWRLHVSPGASMSPAAPTRSQGGWRRTGGAPEQTSSSTSSTRTTSSSTPRRRSPTRPGARAMGRCRGTSASWPHWRCTRGTRGS